MINQLRWLLGSDSRRLNWLLASAVLTALLQGLVFVLLVPVLRAAIDGDQPAIWLWTLALAVVAIGYAVSLWFGSLVGQRLSVDLARGLYRRVGDKVARLPLGTIDLALTGKLARLTSKGVLQIATVPAHFLRPIIHAVGTPTTVMVAMAIIDWRIGLAVLLSLPLLALTYRFTTAIVGKRDSAYAKSIADSAGRIVEFAKVQPALRAFGGSKATHHELERALGRQHQDYRALLIGGSLGMSGFVLAIQAVVTLVIVVAVMFTVSGSVDIAGLVALMVLSLRFTEPLVAVADLGSGMRVSANSLAEMKAVLESPELPEPVTPEQAPWPVDSEITLKQVSFSYHSGVEVLSDINFSIPAGTTTALVGPSGSGKTTLTKLIARFHDVDSGQVLIGGVDVRELGTAHTMGVVSPVFQDVYLFSGSLLDNIRMGRPEASDEEVFAAARAAEVDEIAERLGQGWDSPVGEGGNLLSGGERQRVSIARAILKDAPILLLDEATSSLDPVNEQAISRALHHLEGKTRLVIAHRLDTVVGADQIVVLTADGRVAEVGTHASLLAAGGPYAAFWESRTKAAGWTLATSK